MKLRNTEFFGVGFVNEGVVKTGVKHLTMKGDVGATCKQKRVQTDSCLKLFRDNFSCTLSSIVKDF